MGVMSGFLRVMRLCSSSCWLWYHPEAFVGLVVWCCALSCWVSRATRRHSRVQWRTTRCLCYWGFSSYARIPVVLGPWPTRRHSRVSVAHRAVLNPWESRQAIFESICLSSSSCWLWYHPQAFVGLVVRCCALSCWVSRATRRHSRVQWRTARCLCYWGFSSYARIPVVLGPWATRRHSRVSVAHGACAIGVSRRTDAFHLCCGLLVFFSGPIELVYFRDRSYWVLGLPEGIRGSSGAPRSA